MRGHKMVSALIYVLAVSMAASITPARGCQGPSEHILTFLRELPSTAANEQVVAKIETIRLLEPERWRLGQRGGLTHRIQVQVIEGIKSVQAGDILIVDIGVSSCNFPVGPEAIGIQAYIAGSIQTINGNAVFIGQWRWYPSVGRGYAKVD